MHSSSAEQKCSERKLKMVIWYHVEVAYQITDFIGQFFELYFSARLFGDSDGQAEALRSSLSDWRTTAFAAAVFLPLSSLRLARWLAYSALEWRATHSHVRSFELLTKNFLVRSFRQAFSSCCWFFNSKFPTLNFQQGNSDWQGAQPPWQRVFAKPLDASMPIFS